MTDTTTTASVTTAPDTAATGPVFAETDPSGASFSDAVTAEYSEWEAAGPIWIGGVLAFTQGQRVNRSHPMIRQWQAEGSVRPVTRA